MSFDAAFDRKAFRLQGLVDSVEYGKNYCTDGNLSYFDVIFPGRHIRNVYDKRDTHNVESINADLRHYISGLARRSRCFYRKLETLQAVLNVFAEAYNAFGVAKMKFRQNRDPKSRELPFSVLDYI